MKGGGGGRGGGEIGVRIGGVREGGEMGVEMGVRIGGVRGEGTFVITTILLPGCACLCVYFLNCRF